MKTEVNQVSEDLTFKTAVSLKGHDTNRRYVILSQAGADFVLVADGEYRKLDNPKLKRLKHLRIDGESGLKAKGLTDEQLKKVLKKQVSEECYAEGRQY